MDNLFAAYSNITSVSFGYKIQDGKQTQEVALLISVKAKGFAPVGETNIPSNFGKIPTDIIESHCSIVGVFGEVERLGEYDPLVPGRLEIQFKLTSKV